MAASYDAVVVGAGPNGLAAAIELARAGRKVVVFEAGETAGGGARSAELTLPGFVHDVCSAVHPMAVASPVFASLPLARHGLEWIFPPAAVAHPFDDGTAAAVGGTVEQTAEELGEDGAAYRRLLGPLVADWEALRGPLLGPLRLLPRHPVKMARFGLRGMRSAAGLARGAFGGERARAVFAGMAAHSMLPMERSGSAAFGLVLGITAHTTGWPVARGGSQKIADALAAVLDKLGGEVVTGRRVGSLGELPPARAVLCDVTPRQLLRLAGERLDGGFRRRLERFRYGPGAYKMDWALDGPIPWRAEECRRAATVHVGGTLAEIAEAERAAWEGREAERPFLILTQPSLFDPGRAPAGKHTAWAYCHVPNGSGAEMTARVEAQIERFAPGFRERVLARAAMGPAELERHNANLVGGDIGGGANLLGQLFARPTRRTYRTPARGLYLCSASTPPGAGVHGMCGYHAARAALEDGC